MTDARELLTRPIPIWHSIVVAVAIGVAAYFLGRAEESARTRSMLERMKATADERRGPTDAAPGS